MGKHEGSEKLSRNKALRELHARHPEMSYRELGELFGVSRQRVWTIVKGDHKAEVEWVKRERS